MIIPVGFGQVTFAFSGSGVPEGAVVTMGFENGLPMTAAAAAGLLGENFELTILPELVQNTGLDHTLVKLGPNSTGPTAIEPSGLAGSDLSAQAPPNVSYLIHKNTALGGRKGRGRFYLPGVDETVVLQGGSIDSAKVTALETAVNAFHAACVADDLTPYLLHSDSTPPTLITDFDMDSRVATQRKRLRR